MNGTSNIGKNDDQARVNLLLTKEIEEIVAVVGDDGPLFFNIAFEPMLKEIYSKIRDPEWQERHGSGLFILLALEAFSQLSKRAAFTNFWTIWDHLFASLNQHWLSKEGIRHANSKDKVAFILSHFRIRPSLSKEDHKGIERLVAVRNKLVHHGRFPEGTDLKVVEMFAKLTDIVVTRALGVEPTDFKLRGASKLLDEFLNSK